MLEDNAILQELISCKSRIARIRPILSERVKGSSTIIVKFRISLALSLLHKLFLKLGFEAIKAFNALFNNRVCLSESFKYSRSARILRNIFKALAYLRYETLQKESTSLLIANKVYFKKACSALTLKWRVWSRWSIMQKVILDRVAIRRNRKLQKGTLRNWHGNILANKLRKQNMKWAFDALT